MNDTVTQERPDLGTTDRCNSQYLMVGNAPTILRSKWSVLLLTLLYGLIPVLYRGDQPSRIKQTISDIRLWSLLSYCI